MNQKINESFLALGNAALRKSDYSKAIENYRKALIQMPQFRDIINSNIILAQAKQRRNVSAAGSHRDKNFSFQSCVLGIIVLNLNGASLLEQLFGSLAKNRPSVSFAVYVTDHNSSDDSRRVLEKWAQFLPLHVYYAENNYTFSFSNNRWAEQLNECEYLLFLNNDIIFGENVIDDMIKLLNDPTVGVVGVEQLEPSSNEQECRWHHLGIGFRWDKEFEFWRPFNIQSPSHHREEMWRCVPAVTGSVMLVRRNDFLGVGGFDEGYVYGYEDVDLCLKILSKLGKKSLCLRSENVIHQDGVTRKKTVSAEIKKQRLGNIRLFKEKYTSLVTRLQRRHALRDVPIHQGRARVVFAVTETGPNASAGDLFTAIELGSALEKAFGWIVEYRPRGEAWYTLDGIDVVVAMVDAYNPRLITQAHPGLVKVAWARNWFERWCDREWHDEYDFYFASSDLSANYIRSRTGVNAGILRIATNPEKFDASLRSPSPIIDFVFTGSYWNADRDIEKALMCIPKELKGEVYGKNWEKVPALKKFFKGFVPYNSIPEIYRHSIIVLDDANHVTKPWGSVNSRVFDALAAGCLVITNSRLASEDAFGGKLPFYESPEELGEILLHFLHNQQARQTLIDELRGRVLAEHTYSHRAYSFRDQLASYLNNSLRVALKIPVPKREVANEWGDYHFAVSLAREMRMKGNRVRIDFLPDWNKGDLEGDDVNIVLRGLSKYKVRRNQVNYVWVISHPGKIEDEELNSYDRVFVASSVYAEKLRRRLRVPVEVLLQCTDGKKFNLAARSYGSKPDIDLLFVGNSRNEYRRIVKDSIAAGLKPDIYGTRWEQFIPSDLIKGENLPNDILPSYYGRARVVLNDHWADMAENGFISNRVFDAVACGAIVVSDECVGIHDIFGQSVVTYGEERSLEDAIELAKKSRVPANYFMQEHDFRNRADVIGMRLREMIRI